MSTIQDLKAQYETAKKQFRTAMIQYETEQTEEARQIFEESKAQMRGIFEDLQTLSMNAIARQSTIDRNTTTQLDTNRETVQEYQSISQTASSTLESMLASYPMYHEMNMRTWFVYAHLALIVVGIIGTLGMMVIHSRTKPPSSPTKPANIRKIPNQALTQLKNTKDALQKQTQEVGKKALNVADKAVVQGKNSTKKLYDTFLNGMFGKIPNEGNKKN